MMLRIPTGWHTFAICCLQQHPKTGLWMVITDEGLLYEGPERCVPEVGPFGDHDRKSWVRAW